MTHGLKTTNHPVQADRPRPACLVTLALATAALALLVLAPGASARTTRPYESSFGSFPAVGEGASPSTVSVDQSNGDVYVLASHESAGGEENDRVVQRFNSAGAPKNFTAGPDAGTNILTGFPSHRAGIAIDNSGGPLNGDIYVATGAKNDGNAHSGLVKVYAPSGAGLGAITGLGPGDFGVCGVAVDQTDGSLYVRTVGGSTIWRYAPASPNGSIDDADYAVSSIQADIGTSPSEPCSIAADAGKVYAGSKGNSSPDRTLRRYAAADFTPSGPQVAGTVVDDYSTAVAVDPETGDVYSDEGNRIAVFDSTGASLYEFGAAAYFGVDSQGIAVKSAASGPATKVYVADDSPSHTVDVFGPLAKAPTYSHNEIASFGP